MHCSIVNALVTGSGFDLNSATASGGALFASNVNYSIIVVDSGFDRNKAAGKRLPSARCV